MSNPNGETSFNIAPWVADTGNTPEESLNEGRRDYSLNISRSPYRVSSSIASNTNFCPIENLNNDSLTENSVPKRDPLNSTHHTQRKHQIISCDDKTRFQKRKREIIKQSPPEPFVKDVEPYDPFELVGFQCYLDAPEYHPTPIQ